MLSNKFDNWETIQSIIIGNKIIVYTSVVVVLKQRQGFIDNLTQGYIL